MSVGLFVKKFLSFFLEPLGMVLALFVLGFFFFYRKNTLKAERYFLGALLLLLLFSYPPFANFLITQLENQYPKYSANTHVEYIHVLGNGHTTDPMQPISSQLSDDGVKRVLEGVILHKRFPHTKIIFSGYEGRTDTPNAVMNARLAYTLGVEHNATIIATKPDDTYQEALFCKSVVGTQPFILVTSASHMPRAMMLFTSLGMHPIAAPTAFHKRNTTSWLSAPNVYALATSTMAMHEYVGIVYGKLKSAIRAVFS